MKNLRIEFMQNGLIRVYDYGCNWASCYDAKTGEYKHGGVNCEEYRTAVKNAIAERQYQIDINRLTVN